MVGRGYQLENLRIHFFAHKATKNELSIKLSTVTLSALLAIDIIPAKDRDGSIHTDEPHPCVNGAAALAGSQILMIGGDCICDIVLLESAGPMISMITE